MNDLREKILEKLNEYNISLYELSKDLNISRNTLYKFMEGDNNIRPSTKEILERWVTNLQIKYIKTTDSKVIASTRVPLEVYNYLSATAEELNVSISDVVRNILYKETNADYANRGILESISIVEKSLSSIIENRVISFIRQQDKMLLDMYAEIAWLSERLYMATASEINEETYSKYMDDKQIFIEDFKDKMFRHNKN
ncbi:MAG: hypothetical protein MR601_04125 [Erysipelotrichaceae bacterium]|nr:hypothetical protein [Erysipelotrichaceae bacterium]